MNIVFSGMIFIAFVTAAWRQVVWIPDASAQAPMAALTSAMVDSAAGSVELALGLIGVMTLFLGLMRIAEAGGMLTVLSRLIRPLMVRLFPDVPPDHPAMGAMILNMAANVLGLGNAATPFGIRAMQALDELNTKKGTATDAMALFLAINTSSVTLLPTGVIALRAAAGSSDPAAILPTTLFATFCSTLTAVTAAKIYARLAGGGPRRTKMAVSPGDPPPNCEGDPKDKDPEARGYPLWVSLVALAAIASLVPLAVVYGRQASPWILPSLACAFLLFGIVRRVRIYEVFVEGAKEGFQVAVRIIPYLVAILVAVGMLRASGALEAAVDFLGVWTHRVGLPAEALPMALLRPLSGSGAYGIMAAIINDPAVGPDSYTGMLVSTLQGSTETTFYVLAVYFGAIQVRKTRHTLAAALTADAAGIAAAVFICRMLFA